MKTALALIIFACIEIYVFQGVKTTLSDFSKSIKWTGISIFIIQAVFCVSVFTFMVSKGREAFEYEHFKYLFLIAFILLVGKLFMLVFILIDDLIRLVRYVFAYTKSPNNKGPEISRLKFLSQAGAFFGALPIAGLTYGVIKGAHHYKVHKVDLKLKNLPKSFVGKKLVQISDIHAGSFWDKEAVEKGIDKLMELEPDLVFFTGDLVNDKAEELNEYQSVFAKISAPLGVYSVLGNHDYGEYIKWPTPEEQAANLEDLKKRQKEMGWQLLLNEHKTIEENGEKLVIVGIEYFGSNRMLRIQRGNMSEAMKDVDPNDPILLLSHDPSHWKYEVLKKYPMVDAMFSGHTHGAQFGIETARFKWSPVKYMYKEWAGLYREGDNQLYVNRGFGYLGYPGRLGIRPEITLFTLQNA